MSRKFVNFEIILIYFLLLIPWPHTQIIKLFCSKDNSRLVRKIVRSKWTPILDKYQVKLPLECPLHPFRDVFSPRQDAKKRDRPTQWTCRLCGKSFYQEKFLDLHFETRHRAVINEAEDAVCLADYCDIMRCEVFQTEESSSLKTGDQHTVTDIEVWGDSLGQNSALAKANVAYLSLIPLRTSSIGATRAAKVQNRQLCQDKIGQNKFKDTVEHLDTAEKATTNTINESPVKRSHADGGATSAPSGTSSGGNTASASATGAAAAASSAKHSKAANKQTPPQTNKPKNKSNDGLNGGHDDDSSNATSGAGDGNKTMNGSNDNGNSSATNMQKMRANCKAEELGKLKASCELLVRSCIGSLLLSMTEQSFKEMEEDMNKAVCWYLSCDRYWEDGPLEPRAFPWGLILILIFVLSTGICFCYYIIWILFDSEETTINANHHAYMYHPYQAYPPTAGMHGAVPPPPGYYYQQQAPAHELYPEQPQYDYRHSPRRYIGEPHPHPQGTPPASGAPITGAAIQTPMHHHPPTSHAYPQDILDRRDYTSSRIATTAVTGGSGLAANTSGAAPAAASSASAGNKADSDAAAMAAHGGGGGGGGRHYNTHPRPLGTQHRHAGASQQSLRASASSHEIIQSDMGQNEHYIYVTYPPDLKKRYYDKYE